MRRGRVIVSVVVLALVAASACGGGSSKKATRPSASRSSGPSSAGSAAAGPSTAGKTKLPACPLDALKKASGPVEITLWHPMTRTNLDALKAMVAAFEASQPKVKVKLVNQTSYDDVLEKFRAGLSTGDLPDVVMLGETSLQVAIDSKAMLPAQSCVDADHYDTADLVERIRSYYTVQGVLWPLPFNTSDFVLYYDKSDFTRAGLDPAKPPTTFAELRAAAQKLKASGIKTPVILKADPALVEQWMAQSGQPLADHANGRDARATKTLLDSKAGRDAFAFYSSMTADGLMRTVNPTSFDNLLAIGSGDATMTIESGAALGGIKSVVASGGQADKAIQLGVGPFPGPEGKGGVFVGGAALYIVNKSAPEKQAAAWEFMKFATSPETQAKWAAATGYVPTRRSAVDQPVLRDAWAASPELRVGYDELVGGPNNTATSGPVLGPYAEIRKAVAQELQAITTARKTPDAAAKDAAAAANRVLAEYNSRVGG